MALRNTFSSIFPRGLATTLLLVSLQAVAANGPATYRLDPVHTRVVFAVSHAGFSQAIGTVSGSTGTLRFDPSDWSSAKLEVSVPLARVDLGDADWNQAVQGRKLLYTRVYPVAIFSSTRVEPIDADHAAVFGTLRLHGMTKEIKLDVVLNQLKRHPMPPFHETAGFSAITTINRADFGIDTWPSLIGDAVELRIEAEAVLDRDTGKEASDTPAPPNAGHDENEAPTAPIEPDAADTTTPTLEPTRTP